MHQPPLETRQFFLQSLECRVTTSGILVWLLDDLEKTRERPGDRFITFVLGLVGIVLLQAFVNFMDAVSR